MTIFNLNVKESLSILWVKFRKNFFNYCGNFDNFLIVNTLREEFGHGASLRLRVLFLFSLDSLEILSELFVLRAQLNSFLDVTNSVVKVLELRVSYTSQIIGFSRGTVNLNNFGAFIYTLAIMADAVKADGSILETADPKLFHILIVIPSLHFVKSFDSLIV